MTTSDIVLNSFEKMIASRMMIHINHFCEEVPDNQRYCQQPMTQLHPQLAELIRETEVAGIILFASNFVATDQAVTLAYDIQQARPQSDLPLLIAVDQEGGRVTRLPRHSTTSFSGNMAIGATYQQYGDYYAKQVGRIVGKELHALGINVNFAPTLDVNSNPDNPVINVRSFSENPQQVAQLGGAMVQAMQAEGVAAALKHFPGHGDTEVDSHTGLPRIDRSLDELLTTDLLPFAEVIAEAKPAMVMTAHIQYPQIDSDELMAMDGKAMIAPATMSRTILTGLLRERLDFEGVIVTDALGMAGISDYFDPVQAVVETFRAGADLALMPFHIDRVSDITQFKRFVRQVATQLQQLDYSALEMSQAIQRINDLRRKLTLSHSSLAEQINAAETLVGNRQHRLVEWQLANRAVTMIRNEQTLPWVNDKISTLEMIVDDPIQAELLSDALLHYWPMNNHNLLSIKTTFWSDIKAEDLAPAQRNHRLIIVDFGYHSQVDDSAAEFQLLEKEQKIARLEALLNSEDQTQSILVAMQSPYDLMDFIDRADASIAVYHSVIYQDPAKQSYQGLSYQALAAMLTGITKPEGHLPVSLTHRSDYQPKEK